MVRVQGQGIEAERDTRIADLDRVGRALDSKGTTTIKPGKRAGAKKAKTAAALAGERRAAIMRLLGERAEPLALGEIHRTLRISEFSARSALRRLMSEGKVHRLGTGAATRYETNPSGPTSGASSADGRSGTLQGRTLADPLPRPPPYLRHADGRSRGSPCETFRSGWATATTGPR